MNLELYATYFVYTGIYIVFAIALKYILNMRSSKVFSSDQAITNGNLAVGLRRCGAQFGLGLAIMGVLSGSSSGSLGTDVMLTILYAALGMAMMLSSLLITDKLVLPSVSNNDQLNNNNLAVGVVEFGMLIATGLIAYSSIYGEGGGPISAIVYFILGQVTLLALIRVYNNVIVRHTNLIDNVSSNQLASGIYLAGKLIAYALILKSAIAGNTPDVSMTQLAINYITLAVSGMILLYVFEFIIDKFIITTTSVSALLKENRIVPALQLSIMKISVALILSIAIL